MADRVEVGHLATYGFIVDIDRAAREVVLITPTAYSEGLVDRFTPEMTRQLAQALLDAALSLSKAS